MSVETDYPTGSAAEGVLSDSAGVSGPPGGSLQLEFFDGPGDSRWVPRIVTVWAKPEFL